MHRGASRNDEVWEAHAIRGSRQPANLNIHPFLAELPRGFARRAGAAFKDGSAADTLGSSLLICKLGEWWLPGLRRACSGQRSPIGRRARWSRHTLASDQVEAYSRCSLPATSRHLKLKPPPGGRGPQAIYPLRRPLVSCRPSPSSLRHLSPGSPATAHSYCRVAFVGVSQVCVCIYS